MTTTISKQFSDLTKHEEDLGNNDSCTFKKASLTEKCGKPMTHYTYCPENNCGSVGRACAEHTAYILNAKYDRTNLAKVRCSSNHVSLLGDVILIPK
jgi:hypothetical protein